MKLFFSTFIIYLAVTSCKPLHNEEKDSGLKAFPKSHPLPYNVLPVTSCDTAPVSDVITMRHPSNNKNIVLRYTNSTIVDYLTPDWENRIQRTDDFFTEKNLNGYDSDELKLTVIDIRNVNGRPHYHYFSNGTTMQTLQNMSATKFMGASFSVHRIRQLSKGRIGADVRYNSRVLASDLDIIGNVSENRYAAAVKTLGGNAHAEFMIENWMLAGYRDPSITGSKVDYFGGSWGARSDFCGESVPFPTKYVTDLTTGEKLNLPEVCPKEVNPKKPYNCASYINCDCRGKYRNWNHLSGLTFAEWMKRIAVNYRDPVTLPKLIDYKVSRYALPSKRARQTATPSLTKRDIEILMYGTTAYSPEEFKRRSLDKSDCGGKLGPTYSDYRGKKRGGMMWDGLRDWPHNAGGVDRLHELFNDRWRMLGKAGSGQVGIQQGEEKKNFKVEAVIGYICLPKIVKKGSPIFPGKELVVHLHFTNKKNRPGYSYTHIHKAAKAVFDQMVPGLNSNGVLREMGQ